jgi:hypothetical protein
MDTKRILQELRAESERIERAITAILGISSDGASRRTPAKRARHFSAAARKRLSLLMKRRWASGKMKGRAKARPKAKKTALKSPAARKANRKGGITAAGRKRLSEMMKKRWAARKKAKAASA